MTSIAPGTISNDRRERPQLFAVELEEDVLLPPGDRLDAAAADEADLGDGEVAAVDELPAVAAELEEPHALDEDHVEEPVVEPGLRGDLHALAEDPAVGDGADEVFALREVAAVDPDPEPLVPVLDHGLDEAADVGRGPALQAALVDLPDDLAADPEIGDVEEEPLHRRRRTADRNVTRPTSIRAEGASVMTLRASLSPAGMFRLLVRSQPVPGGHDAQARLGVDDPGVLVEAVGDLVHGPVAADADDELRAVLDGGPGELDGLEGLLGEIVAEFLDEVPQALLDLRPSPAGPALVGFGVDDDPGS